MKGARRLTVAQLLACVSLGASLLLPVDARAEGAAQAPSVGVGAVTSTTTRLRAKTPAPAAPPPASAALHVTPGALGTSWTFELTNTDSTPLRLVTDGRLLTLDVTAESATGARGKRVVHCALPDEVRPTTDADRAHVLVPGATYVEEFDPRLYCFDGADAAALVSGSHVVARLGWPGSRAGAVHAPPFIADQVFGGDERTGVKELTAEAVVTPDSLPDEPNAEDTRTKKLVVGAPSHVDAETGRALAIEVTVENTSSRPLHLLLRPETLSFEVLSPKGVHQCRWPRRPGAPIAEVLTEVAPHGRASTSVLLASVCPDITFQHAGLYTVFAGVDTRGVSGKSIGVDIFEAYVRAKTPTLVRIRKTHVPPSR